MPGVEFELTVTPFERAKAVDALDRTASVIGIQKYIHTHTQRERER
jgi:hypothetical protein